MTLSRTVPVTIQTEPRVQNQRGNTGKAQFFLTVANRGRWFVLSMVEKHHQGLHALTAALKLAEIAC